MKQGVPIGYRTAIASRAVAAILGGYAVAALATGCLALMLANWTGMARVEAVITSTLLSFLWFALAVVWVFAADTAWRAWIGLAVPAAVLGLGWLALRSA
ncbi:MULTISPECIES: DUF3649 domain-containing protein [unclassified Cupriavidus]|uniref:DUF3649 domain-containing protein n=1 Tax=unclassified Cupriavidus TaxID=2640874 RepID=UPI001C000056|nr:MULTISPECIES: DUF3649 domain-containing protein [unclassified Cupriavidus]MCA3188196.1 DUF3649 domain-containing protein [Cupriavidus sp.]MCA3192039.1 DUF3649 domain-containing protein [Cupriavidus sp.]MCA3197784.1 DUF3649 domain-containing protein [Cupriavidus sp.]MCA3202836.1 DUF3649 domain-containing protein [Cupriavidus sp.]MCA3210388.1 DUF3649 domain-containing protein [Cupriavidus sp.]